MNKDECLSSLSEVRQTDRTSACEVCELVRSSDREALEGDCQMNYLPTFSLPYRNEDKQPRTGTHRGTRYTKSHPKPRCRQLSSRFPCHWAGNSRCCKTVCCGSWAAGQLGSCSESSPAAARRPGAPPPGGQLHTFGPHLCWTWQPRDFRFFSSHLSLVLPCPPSPCPVSFGSPSARTHQLQTCSGSLAVELWPPPLPRQR